MCCRSLTTRVRSTGKTSLDLSAPPCIARAWGGREVSAMASWVPWPHQLTSLCAWSFTIETVGNNIFLTIPGVSTVQKNAQRFRRRGQRNCSGILESKLASFESGGEDSTMKPPRLSRKLNSAQACCTEISDLLLLSSRRAIPAAGPVPIRWRQNSTRSPPALLPLPPLPAHPAHVIQESHRTITRTKTTTAAMATTTTTSSSTTAAAILREVIPFNTNSLLRRRSRIRHQSIPWRRGSSGGTACQTAGIKTFGWRRSMVGDETGL